MLSWLYVMLTVFQCSEKTILLSKISIQMKMYGRSSYYHWILNGNKWKSCCINSLKRRDQISVDGLFATLSWIAAISSSNHAVYCGPLLDILWTWLLSLDCTMFISVFDSFLLLPISFHYHFFIHNIAPL